MAGPSRTNKYLKLGSLIFLLGIAVYLAVRIAAFVHIFFTHAGTVITQVELADSFRQGAFDSDPAVVPRIIHQIFHNWTHPAEEVLPPDWSAARQTCIDLNPDWEHWLWTEKKSHEFIEINYPWFLETYEHFQFPVQKIDALRYFLMRHYGGIYIDLDNGCLTSLEALRYFPAWVTDGGHGTLSNNILGAEPHHPFWDLVTESIIPYAWNYPLPYITISYATGQWFETAMWEKYHQSLEPGAQGLVRVLMDGRPGASPWVFFNHNRGGTWDNWDNRMFGWVGEHIVLVAASAAVILLSLGGLSILMMRTRSRYRYQRVSHS